MVLQYATAQTEYIRVLAETRLKELKFVDATAGKKHMRVLCITVVIKAPHAFQLIRCK